MKTKFFFGLTQGILGILLMFFTIHVTPKVIMDFRHIANTTRRFLWGWICCNYCWHHNRNI